jgi:hypothetical protein
MSGNLDAVAITVAIREDSPLAAITHLDRAVDRALRASGLFEEFDAMGRTLWAAPREADGWGGRNRHRQ